MLLARWGEFCCVGALPRAVPSADGVCPFRGQGVRSGEIGNVRGLGYLRIKNNYTKSSRIANSTDRDRGKWLQLIETL